MNSGTQKVPQDTVVQELGDLRGWLAQKRPAERRLTNRELLDRSVNAPTPRERSQAADELLRQIKSLCAALVDQQTRARTAQEVDDLAQEVMLRLLQARRRSSDVDPTPAYLSKIATNLLIDQVRFLKRRGLEKTPVSVEESGEVAALADPHPSVEEEALGRLRLRELREVLARALRPTEADVLWLRIEGASHQDIAAALNLREDNARKHCERGLKRLKKLSETGALPAALAFE